MQKILIEIYDNIEAVNEFKELIKEHADKYSIVELGGKWYVYYLQLDTKDLADKVTNCGQDDPAANENEKLA